jgi:ankyrin repeat protein
MMRLLENGAEVDARDQNGRTPLHGAALSRSTAISYILLANLADLEPRDEEGSTPLHLAAARGRAAVVRGLLEAGADSDAKDGQGRTPPELAREAERSPVVKVFRGYLLAKKRRDRLRAEETQGAGAPKSAGGADSADDEPVSSRPAAAESSG